MVIIEGLRSKRALKRRSYALRKRPLKIYGLVYGLSSLNIRMENFFGSLGAVHECFFCLPYLLGVSRLFLDYEYCELPTRRMQKEVKVYYYYYIIIVLFSTEGNRLMDMIVEEDIRAVLRVC